MPTLEDAIALALKAHRGQVDKAGEPYILHPLRVMMRMPHSDEVRMAAVLHDVVEDSDITLAELRQQGYPDAVIAALDALTRREGESYTDFVARAAAHPIARQVKRADIEDNMDLRRLRSITPRDIERLARYRAAWEALQDR